MNLHPDEAVPVIKSIWQRPDWRLIKGARSPEEPTEENERAVQAYVREVEKMVSALEEAKPSGRNVLLRCVSPRDRFRRFWIALGGVSQGTIPRDAQRDVTHQELRLRAAFMALLFSQARGITDLSLERGESIKGACECTSAKCASRGKSREFYNLQEEGLFVGEQLAEFYQILPQNPGIYTESHML